VSVLDRYLGELQGTRVRIAEESLTSIPDSDKNAFGYGRAVGRLEGLRLAEETLQRVLSESEADQSGSGRYRSSKA
jgi:hypothetical protein